MKKYNEAKEYKQLPFFVKELDEDQGIVDAIVAVFGNVDLGNDIIEPGAFTKTISERGHKVKVLDNHNAHSVRDVVGAPRLLEEVGRDALPRAVLEAYPDASGGLRAVTQFLLDTPEGKGVFDRIKAGVVDQYSFGYDPITTKMDTVKQGDDEINVRRLKEVRLWEYSPVIFAMNPATATVGVKGEGEDAEGKVVDVTENTIRIRVRDPKDFEQDSFRTITLSEDEGIQAVVGRLEGETTTTIQVYIFDKEKWTVTEAQAWVNEHEKAADPPEESEETPSELEPETPDDADSPSELEGEEEEQETDSEEPTVLEDLRDAIASMSRALDAFEKELTREEPTPPLPERIEVAAASLAALLEEAKKINVEPEQQDALTSNQEEAEPQETEPLTLQEREELLRKIQTESADLGKLELEARK